MFPLKDNIPLARVPFVTIALVAINVIAYLLEIRHGGGFFSGPSDSVSVHYGAIPYEITHPGRHCGLATVTEGLGSRDFVACQPASQILGAAPEPQPATWETVLTSMFLHGSFLHIFGNMLFLAIFGPTVEDRLGRLRFPVFYLHDGQNLFDGRTSYVVNRTWRAHQTATSRFTCPRRIAASRSASPGRQGSQRRRRASARRTARTAASWRCACRRRALWGCRAKAWRSHRGPRA